MKSVTQETVMEKATNLLPKTWQAEAVGLSSKFHLARGYKLIRFSEKSKFSHIQVDTRMTITFSQESVLLMLVPRSPGLLDSSRFCKLEETDLYCFLMFSFFFF